MDSLFSIQVGDKIRARRAYPADNPQDSADNPRAVAGLAELLSELRLASYTDRADSWCRNMGAVHLDEVSESGELRLSEVGHTETPHSLNCSLAKFRKNKIRKILNLAKIQQTFGKTCENVDKLK